MAVQRGPRTLAVLALLLCTLCWGGSFVVAKGLVDRFDPMSVLAIRFVIGTAIMWVLRPRAVAGLSRTTKWHALVIGLLLGAAQVPHYFGVRESTAAAASFLIGTTVVMTPAVDWLLNRVRVSRTTVAGCVLALAGLALFAAGGTVSSLGLVLCLVAALLYAVQISVLGAWVPASNIWGFTTMTMLGITPVICIPAILRGVEVPTSGADWARLFYLALVAGIAGVALQGWAMRHIAATQAAVILVLEPVWATSLAVLFIGESPTWQLLLGGGVLLVANLVVARGSRPPRPPQAEVPVVGT